MVQAIYRFQIRLHVANVFYCFSVKRCYVFVTIRWNASYNTSRYFRSIEDTTRSYNGRVEGTYCSFCHMQSVADAACAVPREEFWLSSPNRSLCAACVNWNGNQAEGIFLKFVYARRFFFHWVADRASRGICAIFHPLLWDNATSSTFFQHLSA